MTVQLQKNDVLDYICAIGEILNEILVRSTRFCQKLFKLAQVFFLSLHLVFHDFILNFAQSSKTENAIYKAVLKVFLHSKS